MSTTFTYTHDPSASDRDWIRWRLSDTNCDAPLQWDEELAGLLALYPTKYLAAAAAARAVAQGFALKVDITMGKLSIKHSQRAEQYAAMADELEDEGGASTSAAPWSASISRSRKQGYREDSDRTLPAFARGMHDTEPGQSGERNLYGSTDGVP